MKIEGGIEMNKFYINKVYEEFVGIRTFFFESNDINNHENSITKESFFSVLDYAEYLYYYNLTKDAKDIHVTKLAYGFAMIVS